MPERSDVGRRADDHLDHRPARQHEAVQHEDDELDERPRVEAVVHRRARSTGNSTTSSDARAPTPPSDVARRVTSPCSSSQIADEHHEQRQPVDADARFIDPSTTVGVAPGDDQVGRGALAQRVDRPGERRATASPTATSATVASTIGRRPARRSRGRTRRRARPARRRSGASAPARPRTPTARSCVIDTRVSRLHAIATATTHALAGVEAGGDQPELGDEARRTAGCPTG